MSGQYSDPNTGLILMGARWYDPATGQFLTVDPLVAQTQQPYAYANDNPVNDTDPTGLDDTIPASVGPYAGQSAATAGARFAADCQQNPNANICSFSLGSWQACVGGSVSPLSFTVGFDVCFVSTLHGSGLAVTPSASVGPGLGFNVHAGAGTSNACSPSDYSSWFWQYGGSATEGLGAYATRFGNGKISGVTSGVTAGAGADAADAGGGGSYTWVITF